MYRTTRGLLRRGYTRKMPLRLLGVHLSHFMDEQDREPGLFGNADRRGPVLDAVEKIREKFGDDIIHVGGA